MRIPVSTLLLFIAINSHGMDTLTVHATSDCSDFMPHRKHIVLSPDSPDEEPIQYSDSIRVCGEIVEGFRKNYYLIVYDKSGTKRMEGNFWDHLANGHCINYDFRGRKISEGDYKLVKKRKYYYPSVKTGTWIYYDISGKVIKKEEFRWTNILNYEYHYNFRRETSRKSGGDPAFLIIP